MPRHHRPTDELLDHLGLAPEAPTLGYLHRLVAAHQRRVPFETLTKLIDHEPGVARGDFMPPLAEYIGRIVRRGGGGLCWTLARGFRVLLADLGFDASLMVMEPGHCCVRVDLPDGPQYADVGYAAPIFRAYPLFESFTLDTHREQFVYQVGDDGIVVTRRPGPSKRLDPSPRQLAELRGRIAAANDWSVPHSFLHRLAYAREVDGVFTSFRDGTLTSYRPGGTETTELAPADAPGALAEVFGVDPDLCVEAARVLARRAPRRLR